MATIFWIEVNLLGVDYLYRCEMMGLKYYVSGKNKSIIIGHEGQLLAGEIREELVPPIFEAIQRQLRPPGTARIVSIHTPKQ